jgi:hypothetical protein
MLDISQTEQRLGSFSDNPTRYHKELLCLTQACALTWDDIYYIINDTLTEDEKERIWKAAQQHADQLHEQHPNSYPHIAEAVPKTEPQWSCQDGDPGSNSQDHMISCLLAAMDKNSHRQVNYDKIKEITQNPDENPTLFLFFLIFILFICAYNVWVISNPLPLTPLSSRYPAETILPLSLILLKREYKQ